MESNHQDAFQDVSPRMADGALADESSVNVEAALLSIASHTAEERLLNASGRKELDISAALATAWRLFKPNAMYYILWALMLNVLLTTCTWVARIIWYMEPRPLYELPWIVLALTYLPSVILFPMLYGPFVSAANSLRAGGSGFSWKDLFLNHCSYYSPTLLGLSVCLFVIFGLAALVCALPSLILVKLVDSTPSPLLYILLIMLSYLPMIFIMVRLSFTSSLFLEYHEEFGIYKSLVISYKGTGRVFWDLALFSVVSCALVLAGYACMLVGSMVALPVVMLAWADAFDQVFGMNGAFSGVPSGCMGCV